MHSFICSSLPLSSLQIVSGHISTPLIVEDDTERDLMRLKLPLAHPIPLHMKRKRKWEQEREK